MLKKIFLFNLILFFTISVAAQVLHNENRIFVSGGYLVITGTCQNESAADITLDGTLTLTGNWINNSSATVITGTGTNGTVLFNGNTIQTIGGSAAQSNFENLTVDTGAIVDVEAGKFVTVFGATTNNGTMNLRSASGGTASLITGSASGNNNNVERYMTGNQWHNLSSPVSGLSIQSFLTTPGNNIPIKGTTVDTFGMEYYNEGAGVWTYYDENNIGVAGNFIPGRGYLTRNTANGVVTFPGPLNYGDIDIPITQSRYGWNAIGNPYTSAIAFTLRSGGEEPFLEYNSLPYGVDPALDPDFAAGYFWNGTDYTIRNNTEPEPGTFIQPGQGFLVRSKTGGGTINFVPLMQVHSNPTFYKKSSSSEWDRIKLNVSSATESSFTKVLFRDDMTRGLDITYDAGRFGGNSKFLLYTRLLEDNGVNFAIQCLPSQEVDNMVVPIGFNCTNGGLVSFSAEINSLPAGYMAILEDRLLGTYTDLNSGNSKYEIALPAGTSGTGRFFLHAVVDPNSIDLQNIRKINTFAVRKEIFIKGEVTEGSVASVYDVLGRKVADYLLEPGNLNTIKADSFNEGFYIVKVTDKVVLKTDRVYIGE